MSWTLSRLKREAGLLSRCPSRNGPHLALRGESPGFSRVAEGNLGFLSRYDWDLMDPLVLPQDSPVSMQFARGFSDFLSSHCQILSAHLELRPEPHVFLSSADVFFGVPMEFQQGSQPRLLWVHASPLSSRAEKAVSGFLSN